MFQKMDQATTVQEIVQRNTGLSLEEFLFPEEESIFISAYRSGSLFQST